MKDKEQNLGRLSRLGLGLAAFGLAATGCGTTVPEGVQKSLIGPHHRITKSSPHVYNVDTQAVWSWDSMYGLERGVQRIIELCGENNIELVRDDGTHAKIVVVTQADCITELK